MMRSSSVAVVVAAVLVAGVVALADAQTRPNIPETFIADCEIEFHDEDRRARFGEGFFASDASGQRMVEMYDIREGFRVTHMLDLQRFDLRKQYFLSSEDRHDCVERDLRGEFIPPFAFVKNATFVGEHKVHERTLDAWEAHFGGVRLLLAVSPDNPNVPVAMERESVHELSRYIFREFNATTPPEKVFVPPSECKETAAVLRADPTRPAIPESFLASCEIELHDGHEGTRFGEGFYANDQNGGRSAEAYDFHSGDHVFHLFDLQRYDLHKAYSISSEDRHDCHTRDIKGSLTPPFSWVSDAHFVGEHKVHEQTLDAWEYRAGGVRLFIAVDQDNPNRPVAAERESLREFTRYYFREFNATVPEGKYFNVPQECQG